MVQDISLPRGDSNGNLWCKITCVNVGFDRYFPLRLKSEIWERKGSRVSVKDKTTIWKNGDDSSKAEFFELIAEKLACVRTNGDL